MASNDIEIEIKLELFNPKEVEDFLNKNGEIVSKDIYQKDTYYIPAHRDFFNITYPSERLRIRESDKGDSINYKYYYPYNSSVTTHCDEYESKIDNKEALKKIFSSLDIKEAVVVEKKRSTWNYKDAEIVIDEVTDLGTYMELELRTHVDDPQKGRAILFDILEDLNAEVSEENYKGYPRIILENKGYKFGE